MNVELKTGLTACNQCKNRRNSDSILLDGACLASPIIRFDFNEGKEYFSGYKDCYDINKGNRELFEQKLPEQPKKKWWKGGLNKMRCEQEPVVPPKKDIEIEHSTTIHYGNLNDNSRKFKAFCSCGQEFKTLEEALNHKEEFNEDKMSYERCYSCNHSTTYRRTENSGPIGFTHTKYYLEIVCSVTGKSIKIDKCPK
jgi:hypothetical protein